MKGSLNPVASPAAEPIDLEEAKAHLRVDWEDEDTHIGLLVASARSHVERITGRALVRQAFDYALDAFPGCGRIQVPRPPLRSLSSITYFDDDLVGSTVFDSTKYQVDTLKEPAEVALKFGESWPTDTLRGSSGVVVRFVAGYEVPFTFDENTNIITAVGHWFEVDDVVRVRVSGGEDGALPTGLQAGVDYHVINVNGDDFQLSTSQGGAPVAVKAVGPGTFFVYPDEPTPADLRKYILLLIGTMYLNRESEITGTIRAKMQFADGLLANHRAWLRG